MAEGSHSSSSPPKTCEVCRCQHRQEGNTGGKDKRQKTKDKRQKTNTEDKTWRGNPTNCQHRQEGNSGGKDNKMEL